MIPWHGGDRLCLDRDGILWEWTDPGFRRLGPVEHADAPDELAGALEELLDLWRDATADGDGRTVYRTVYGG